MARKRKVRVRKRRSVAERLRTLPGWSKSFIGVALISVLIVAGGQAARRYAVADGRLVIPIKWAEVSGLPDYLDPLSRRELAAPPEALLPERVNLLDRTPLLRIAKYYEEHPWVEAVEYFEYVFPGAGGQGGIRGSLRLVEPLCLVGWDSDRRFYFVDEAGRRLSGPIERPPDGKWRFPAVCWACNLPLPPRGMAWRDESVAHGLHVARLLKAEGLIRTYAHWVAWIDVTGVGRWNRSEVALVTENRVTLQWGRTTLSSARGRIPVARKAEKLARLKAVLSGRVVVPAGVELNLFEPLSPQLRELGYLEKGRL